MTTYTKLRSGAWGIRTDGTVRPGGTVTVTTKAGASKSETVHKVIWTDGKVTLASIRSSSHGSNRSYADGCEACEWNEDAGDMNGCAKHRGNSRA